MSNEGECSNSIFTKLCWVCLSEQENMQSLLEDTPKVKISSNEPSLPPYSILTYVTSSIFESDILFDGGPYLMCNSCLSQACAAYRFKKRCETSKGVFQRCGLSTCSKETYKVKLKNLNINNDKEVIEESSSCQSVKDSRTTGDLHDPELITSKSETVVNDVSIKSEPEITVAENVISEQLIIETKLECLPTEQNRTKNDCNNINKEKINISKVHRQEGLNNGSIKRATVICPVCGKSKARNHIKLHMATHENTRPHACSYCPRRFNAKANLVVHLRIHTKQFPYLCNTCGKTFAQSSTYKVHMRIHDDVKPYQCHICEYRTRTSSHLQKHIQRHMGHKTYACNNCDFMACTGSELKSHMAKHSDDKLHVCKVCNKAFARKKTLKVHEQSHTGNKPHVCNLCGRGFTQAHSLRSHLRNLHKPD